MGCERIFDDKASGARTERPGLNRALEQLRDGDTLVVRRLDRLRRSLKDLIARAEELKEMGAGLKSLRESIDTTSSGGQLIFHLFGSLADLAAPAGSAAKVALRKVWTVPRGPVRKQCGFSPMIAGWLHAIRVRSHVIRVWPCRWTHSIRAENHDECRPKRL